MMQRLSTTQQCESCQTGLFKDLHNFIFLTKLLFGLKSLEFFSGTFCLLVALSDWTSTQHLLWWTCTCCGEPVPVLRRSKTSSVSQMLWNRVWTWPWQSGSAAGSGRSLSEPPSCTDPPPPHCLHASLGPSIRRMRTPWRSTGTKR